jgi:hypothetical protein
MEGRGVMRKAAGGQYEGEFSDSRRHGAGVETFGPSNVRRKATLFLIFTVDDSHLVKWFFTHASRA